MPVSNAKPISVYPDTPIQREQIIEQANKQGEDISEYCLKATRQRLARERQGYPGSGTGLAAQMEDLADEVAAEIAAVANPERPREMAYLIALWELLASDYPSDERAEAMDQATEILAQQVAALREQGGDDI